MSESFTFVLPLPPTSNLMYSPGAGGGRYKSGAYKDWLNTGAVAEAALWQPPPGRLGVDIRIALPKASLSRRDLDNFCKPLLDVVIGKGHDQRVYILFLEKVPAWEGPCAYVTVTPLIGATEGAS
jgi:Holliday junction resolvase RusA-like endonuclease